MLLTDYLRNKLIDHEFRAVAYSAPASKYIGLIRATAGQSPRSTAVTSGQTTIPATPNGRLYRCTTAGTTGGTEPAWPTTSGGTVSDGTAVWTEMSPDFRANTNITEVSGGAYARQNLGPSAANWASTGGATTTTNPSAGTTGTTSNNAAITHPTATANWGLVAFIGIFDAVTSGNLGWVVPLAVPQLVNSGSTFSFAISQLAITIDP
jgi:hypothetical protein